jgi:tetrahedral aminopeptidase
MDEVGFMLVAEDGEGIYEFKTIGGIDARNLAGKQVVVGKDHTPGVIGAKPIHLTKSEERKHAISADTLRVDLGPGVKAKAGERGTFAPNFRRVGPSIMSKSIDDRIGVATLIELFKTAPANIDFLAAFTVQEEIGLRGAKVAAHSFNPDVGIAIDSTPANDLPMQREGENTSYNTRLGYGPAIYLANSSALDDPRLIRFFTKAAEKSKIPFQYRQPGGGGTDAAAIQSSVAGIPVISVSVPHRYTHSAVSIARVEDWKNTLSLLFAALTQISPEILKR